MEIRSYGISGPPVIVLHGGPGAAGYLEPVARRLADSFRVWEPFQRGSGDVPLSVARHVVDLDESIASLNMPERPALVGHSWGAMLALAYSAAHPDRVAALVLVGCGTFDIESRARMNAIRQERMDDSLRQRLDRLNRLAVDPNWQLAAMGRLFMRMDSYDLVSLGTKAVVDAPAHHQTWNDMLRLQEEGVYPAAFAAIRVPVLMLHGRADPHPGTMIEQHLRPYLPQLEHHPLDDCGHYPWLERSAADAFFAVLVKWLTEAGFAKRP